MTLTVLILGGQRQGEPDPVASLTGVPCKALAPVAEIAMIDRVLMAVAAALPNSRWLISLPNVAEIATHAPGLSDALNEGRAIRLDPMASPAQSALAALPHAPAAQPLLITTADHALLTPAILQEFLAGCSAGQTDGADGYAALLPLQRLVETYPGLRRTRLRFQDGGYKGCNLFYFTTPATAAPVLQLWRQLEQDRKHPWRMARRLGLGLLLRYLLGRLSRTQAFAQLSRLTGVRLAPVLLQTPEAALDVDSIADWHFIDTIAR